MIGMQRARAFDQSDVCHEWEQEKKQEKQMYAHNLRHHDVDLKDNNNVKWTKDKMADCLGGQEHWSEVENDDPIMMTDVVPEPLRPMAGRRYRNSLSKVRTKKKA